MSSALLHSLRSRWFVGLTHAALWLLLYLAARGMGGKAPDLHPADSLSSSPQTPVPVARLETLFDSNQWPKPSSDTNVLNLFFTRYFVPPPSPAPPPPPTTKKIEVTYLGYYQAEDSPRQAILKVGEAFVVAHTGAAIAPNLFVAAAGMQSIILTNQTAQTNLLSLNSKKELEVPIK